MTAECHLLAELDARQDDLLAQLDALNARVEAAIASARESGLIADRHSVEA